MRMHARDPACTKVGTSAGGRGDRLGFCGGDEYNHLGEQELLGIRSGAPYMIVPQCSVGGAQYRKPATEIHKIPTIGELAHKC